MNYCYLCRKEISSEIRSEEHIIPNAIGGKLKTFSALCKKHNSDLGEKLDAEFVKIFSHISKLTPVKCDRKVSDNFQGKHIEHDIEVTISKNKIVPSQFKHITEKSIVYAPTVKIKKQYSARAKNEGYDLKFITEIKEGSVEIFSGFDNEIFKQGFAKIAIGFASHYEIKAENLNLVLEDGGFKKKLFILPHYPSFNEIFQIQENSNDKYPFHIIALHSDKSGFLYCYIELFSKFKHYVLLGSDFKDEIHEFYIYSLSKSEELNISDYIDLYPKYSQFKKQFKLESLHKYRDILEYLKELDDVEVPDILQGLTFIDSCTSNKYIEKHLNAEKKDSYQKIIAKFK